MQAPADSGWDSTDGTRLRRALGGAGLSGRRFAALIGVDKDTLNAWLHGRGNPTVTHLRRMASELGVPPCDLLRDKPPPLVAPRRGASGNPGLPLSATCIAVQEAAALLDRLHRAREDLGGVSDLLVDLEEAQRAAQALRRALSDA